MNVAFEDCRILNNLIDEFNFDWEKIFSKFYYRRKPEVDGIAALSLKNLNNLEHSINDDFDIKWKLERKLWELFPEKWMPAYVMIAFNHMSFTEIIEISDKQNQIMNKLLECNEVRNNFMEECFRAKLVEMTEPYILSLNGLGDYIKLSYREMLAFS